MKKLGSDLKKALDKIVEAFENFKKAVAKFVWELGQFFKKFPTFGSWSFKYQVRRYERKYSKKAKEKNERLLRIGKRWEQNHPIAHNPIVYDRDGYVGDGGIVHNKPDQIDNFHFFVLGLDERTDHNKPDTSDPSD